MKHLQTKIPFIVKQREIIIKGNDDTRPRGNRVATVKKLQTNIMNTTLKTNITDERDKK